MTDYSKETMADFVKRIEKQGGAHTEHDKVTLRRMEFCLEVVSRMDGEFDKSQYSWKLLTIASTVAIPWAEEKN